jgi:RNA polymerase sigma-70 factor (ECF subfamily)
MKDSDIIDLYWQRDQEAIAETDRKYGAYCGTIAYNICGSHEDAEECVSSTWLKAWNSMPDERPNILSAFLGAITRNFAINRKSAENAQKRGGGQLTLALDELAECIPTESSPEKTVELKELEMAIDTFLSLLPEQERRIFLCRYWFMASMAEIASRMDCSQSKVKTSLYRTRGKLRKYLQEEGLC